MKCVVADPTGLCFGVRRAVDELESALKKYGIVYSIGSPIHNPQEISRLKDLGLRLCKDASSLPDGAVAFVRAHGVARAEFDELSSRASVIVDGTCPFVRTAQSRASSLSAEGYKVVIFGDREHPEVRGILGYIDGPSVVVSSVDDAAKVVGGRLGVLSQTTQRESALSEIVAKLVLQAGEIKVYNTICRATIDRQSSIKTVAENVDGMIVIGGKNSANTRKLVEISDSLGVSTLWIEHPDEIERGWLAGKQIIGVAAGGSTPDWLINALTEKLMKL